MVAPDLLDVANTVSSCLDATDQKCFLCFGTLLSFVREREFSIYQDIDIGIIGDYDRAIIAFDGLPIIHSVFDDVTNKPYQLTLNTKHDVNIDLFFWKKMNGIYYHTYDVKHEGTGTLKEYTFKGVPAICFDATPETIKMYQQDIRYKGATKFGTWMKPFPQDPTTGMAFPLPFNYGHCLDYWYPDWTTRRPQFGPSEAAHTFTVKTCKGIGWE